MKNTQFALFMVLNGRATEALTFYQEAFAGDILFKITNQEFKERLNPSLTIPAGEEHWLSHSILQMDTFQLSFVCRNEYHAHRTIDPQLNRREPSLCQNNF